VLRIARRDALRAKGRTALVAVMIGLPVLACATVAVLARSGDRDPVARLAVELGDRAQARWSVHANTPIMQSPDGHSTGYRDSARTLGPLTVAATEERLAAALPDRDRLVPVRSGGVKVRVGDRAISTAGRELDLADPGVAGVERLKSGRWPQAADEVLLTRSLARHAGLDVGDRVSIQLQRQDTSRPVQVVGVLAPASGFDRSVVGLPGSLLGSPDPEADVSGEMWHEWLVAGPTPVTWADVQRLNDAGAVAVSRAVLLDPPPDTEVALYTEMQFNSSANGQTIAVAGVAAGLALLEVALLAGPAFAVGARRNRRQLALVAATGGNRRQVRDVVLASGFVTGLGASVLGGVGGVGLAAGLRPLLERWEVAAFPRLDIRPVELAAIVAVGTLTAVGAAVLPALQASRQDVVAALSGRRGQVRLRRRVPVVGLVVAAAGTGLAVFGALSRHSMLVLSGAVLAELGLVATTGALVAGLAKLAPRLRLPARVALRDAARQRGRTAPAVAAVMTAVAGAVAVSVYLATDEARRLDAYTPAAPIGTVLFMDSQSAEAGGAEGQRRLQSAESIIRAHLPIRTTVPLRPLDGVQDGEYQHVYAEISPQMECPLWGAEDVTPEQVAASRDDERCMEQPGPAFTIGSGLVDDGTVLPLFTDQQDRTAVEALADGKVLVPSHTQLWPGSTVHVRIERGSLSEDSNDANTVVVPAAAADIGALQLVVPPSLLDELGIDPPVAGLAASTTAVPAGAEIERAQTALSDADLGDGGYVYVERGYVNEYDLGLLALAVAAAVVALGATGTAVGLAAAESRPDLATLAAVGAAPLVRRRIAAAQAAVVAVLGVGLGVVAGGALGGLIVLMQRHGGLGLDPTWRLVLPWPQLAAVGLGVPLLAVLAGFAFTRSRLPMVRRLGQ
jgi:putative ABC transport system permease protein